MARLLTTAIALSLGGVAPAFAVDAHHPGVSGASASPAMVSAASPEGAAPVSRLLENAKRLQEQAQGLADANTDIERQRLLQQHIQTLRSSMMLSGGMMSGTAGRSGIAGDAMGPAGPMGQGGPGMMGGHMGPGMMGGHMGPGMMGGHMGPGMMGGGMGPGMMGGRRGPGMMTMMMVMMDTDSDGALSLEEVQAVHARLFKYADDDKDGKLTREELHNFFHGTGDPDVD